MRYFVTIGGRTLEVELGVEVRVDGERVRCDLARVPGTATRHLLLDDRSYTIAAEAGESRGLWEVHVLGTRLTVEVEDERTRAIRAMVGAGQGAKGPRPVRAPMPGLVLRVEVEPGQQVEAGQGVVIVEAMKMQNELRAEAAATVARVLVQPGQPVEKGTVLVEFEE